MQVAWALVKIYDHTKGIKVFVGGNNPPSDQLQLIDRNNINQYQVLLGSPNWGKVNFKHFTLFHQAGPNHYNFNFSLVLSALQQ